MKGPPLARTWLLLICILVVNTLLASNDPLGPWSPRFQAPSLPPLNDVVFGSIRFVAVGNAGTIIYSDDGENWTRVESGTTNDLFAVTFAEPLDTFIAVGANQTILKSTDFGVSWSLANSTGTNSLSGVTYGNDRYLAVGVTTYTSFNFTGLTLSSTDGSNWTAVENTNAFSTITFGNGQFVAATPNSYSESVVAKVSSDGINWIDSDFVAGWTAHLTVRRVRFLNGAFYATGVGTYPSFGDGPDSHKPILSSSPDGRVWTSAVISKSDPQSLGDIKDYAAAAFGAGRYVCVGGSGLIDWYSVSLPGVALSTNGTQWIASPGPRSSTTIFKGIAFGNNSVLPGNGVFVAVGQDNGLSTILSTQDGVNWAAGLAKFKSTPKLYDFNQPRFLPDGAAFTAIAASSKTVVAVGTNWITASTNGIDWRSRSFPYAFNAIAYGALPDRSPGGFFIAGADRAIGLSQNGVDWVFTPMSGNIVSVLLANGFIVAADAKAGLLLSRDGVTWTNVSSTFTYPADNQSLNDPWMFAAPKLLAYDGDRFVAITQTVTGPGVTPASLISADAQTWSIGGAIPHGNVSQIVTELEAGKGVFIAGSTVGTLISPDGVNWQVTSSIFPAALAYQNGRFVSVEANGQLHVSTDGRNWSDAGNPWANVASPGAQVRAATFAFDSLFIAGDDGLILQSAKTEPQPQIYIRLDSEGTKIFASAPAGSYRLETSPDLINWTTVQNFDAASVTDLYLTARATATTSEFYRIVK